MKSSKGVAPKKSKFELGQFIRLTFHNKYNGLFCFFLTLDLREILEQNNLYDEVLGQINARLSLRQSIKQANVELSKSARSASQQPKSRPGSINGGGLPSIMARPKLNAEKVADIISSCGSFAKSATRFNPQKIKMP